MAFRRDFLNTKSWESDWDEKSKDYDKHYDKLQYLDSDGEIDELKKEKYVF